MRALLYSVLSLAAVVTTLAADAPAGKPTSKPKDDLEDSEPDTIFNGQTVPPMKELGTTINDDISKGNWLVEFYSPMCPHCMAFKPTWQTLYEFYYTSKSIASTPEKEGDSLNSFTRWYDFKFAKVNCIAYRDMCSEKGVENFPSIIQFKDGNEIKKMKGAQDLSTLSKWVEETLESIRPGSRPQGGPKLPEVGANFVETGPETEDEAKKKEAVVSSATESAKPTSALEVKPKKPKATPNPTGESVVLTAEKFQKMVTNTLDPWFVKFYAPWCHHCQAMGPNWKEMARDMREKLNVGEVNCDVEKRLCKDAHVKGYPTLLFFRGGERIEYNGLRGIGDLIDFAANAVEVGSGVPDVDLKSFRKMEETEEVIFVYFYDHATTSEDFLALERLTLSLIGHAKLVKTKDPEMSKLFEISTWPRLMVSRDGKPSYYSVLAPKDMRDARKVLNWMKSVWLPIVPELTSSNAREIMDGKLVVLGILSRERSDEFIIAKREMKKVAMEWIDKQTQMFQLERQELRDAKQLRIEEAEDRNDQRALRAAKGIRINMDEIERKAVSFAWVDGVFWERWIRTTYGIDVKEGEKVIINDEDNRRYWDVTINGDPIRPSRTSILETLSKVVANPPKISPKSTTSSIERVFFTIRNFCSGHPWLALGVAIGFLLAASVWGKSRMRRKAFGNTGGFFQLDGKEGLLGGTNGGGKVD
ncbi:thioredoxin-like protein [Lindgomyces ingoldianus]|uniref:Thioredoxin-like protein n=1 Tax=Lindgomyces ingoldianus TaxID=673940 RepID=A0ACB6R8U4_9PLEO|nr:thioredoxin-like protein [Lindgomyces ingoldianus]KAF2475694.1 thioredoxin-like protein [Lindgomyces ingoldianus]